MRSPSGAWHGGAGRPMLIYMCTGVVQAMHLERNERCRPRIASARWKGLGRVSRALRRLTPGRLRARCAVCHHAPLCCVRRFGPYCGWAHNTLFISELASMKDRLPPSGGRAASGSSPGAATAATAAEEEGGGSSQARKRQRKGSSSSSSAAADAATPASEAASGEPEAAPEAAAERAGGQRRPPAKAAGLGGAAEGTQQGLGAWRQRKAADLV